jgi:hypothetical protein
MLVNTAIAHCPSHASGLPSLIPAVCVQVAAHSEELSGAQLALARAEGGLAELARRLAANDAAAAAQREAAAAARTLAATTAERMVGVRGGAPCAACAGFLD